VLDAAPRGLRKLLFSATLTRDPARLAPLRLRDPLFFSARDARYQTPRELREFMVPCQAGAKPLVLLHLLRAHDFPPAICFTNSVEASHRLARLLQLFGGANVSPLPPRAPPARPPRAPARGAERAARRRPSSRRGCPRRGARRWWRRWRCPGGTPGGCRC